MVDPVGRSVKLRRGRLIAQGRVVARPSWIDDRRERGKIRVRDRHPFDHRGDSDIAPDHGRYRRGVGTERGERAIDRARTVVTVSRTGRDFRRNNRSPDSAVPARLATIKAAAVVNRSWFKFMVLLKWEDVTTGFRFRWSST